MENEVSSGVESDLSRDEVIAALQRIAGGPGLDLSCGARVVECELSPSLLRGIVRHLNTANIRGMGPEVYGYVADVVGGRWGRCYDPIIFKTDWVLYNGQTRAEAFRQAKLPYSGIVIFNATPESKRGIDGGRKRTIKHLYDVDPAAAAVVRMVLQLEKVSKIKLTNAAVAERYFQTPDIFQHYAKAVKRRTVLRESWLTGAFAFAELSRPRDSDLIRELCEDLTQGDQRFHVSQLIAKYCIEMKRVGIRPGNQTERVRESRKILRAIQAYILGADLTQLQDHEAVCDWYTRGAN